MANPEIDRIRAEVTRLREALESLKEQLKSDVIEHDDLGSMLSQIDAALDKGKA